MSSPLLACQDIRLVFGEPGNETVALDSVSLTIAAGSFTSIMGQSGSGKSTLLHILGLLDYASSGRYELQGKDTAALSEPARAHLRNRVFGFVFQQFHLLARASVLENVMLPLAYSGVPQREHVAKATAALAAVQLSHRLNHTQAQLSGGERQRVAIARALVNDPKVVFADEPTGNLDTKTGQVVMELIKQLHEQGRTVIVITHEHSTAEYAERIIELRDGRIVADQPTKERSHSHQK